MLKGLTALAQQPLHLAAGLALLPLSRLHIETGQAPELAEQGPVIGAAAGGFAVDEAFRHHARLEHPAPATQLLHRQAGPAGRIEHGAAAAAQSRPEAGQAADQHLAHRQGLRLGHQAVAGFVDGDAAQAQATAGQGLRQQMAAIQKELAGRSPTPLLSITGIWS